MEIIRETARGIEERYEVEIEAGGGIRIIYIYCVEHTRRYQQRG